MAKYHMHHIIPKHMGGTDDPENLIEVTIEEHADLHVRLWEEYGNHNDFLAFRGLLGLISKDEIMTEIFRENGKKLGEFMKKNRPTPWNKGKTNIFSKEVLEKLRRPKTEEVKQKLRKPKSTTVNMKKPKSEEHKRNLALANKGKSWFSNIDKMISRQFNLPPSEEGWIKGRRYYQDGELARYKQKTR